MHALSSRWHNHPCNTPIVFTSQVEQAGSHQFICTHGRERLLSRLFLALGVQEALHLCNPPHHQPLAVRHTHHIRPTNQMQAAPSCKAGFPCKAHSLLIAQSDRQQSPSSALPPHHPHAHLDRQLLQQHPQRLSTPVAFAAGNVQAAPACKVRGAPTGPRAEWLCVLAEYAPVAE